MDGNREAQPRRRGTILVASENPGFATAVGDMVLRAGFNVAFPAPREGPWITLARTQPCVVICDCDAPVSRIQPLLSETSVRRVPLLFSGAWQQCCDTRRLNPQHRFGVMTFPVSFEIFSGMLDALLAPAIDSMRRVRWSAVGVGADSTTASVEETPRKQTDSPRRRATDERREDAVVAEAARTEITVAP